MINVEDWFELIDGRLRQQCCDCGLIHDIEVRKRGKVFEMRINRNERATSACRKRKKKDVAIRDHRHGAYSEMKRLHEAHYAGASERLDEGVRQANEFYLGALRTIEHARAIADFYGDIVDAHYKKLVEEQAEYEAKRGHR